MASPPRCKKKKMRQTYEIYIKDPKVNLNKPFACQRLFVPQFYFFPLLGF